MMVSLFYKKLHFFYAYLLNGANIFPSTVELKGYGKEAR